MADFRIKARIRDGDVQAKAAFDGRVSIKAGFTDVVKVGEILPSFAGPYTVTPTRETQVLPTTGKKMAGNVTVNPIPSNYGLITWNGHVLTVT